MSLNTDSGVPLYLQVAEHLREAVAAGVYPPGQPAPSLRTLASDLRVNYHTVGKAYRLLEDDGVIERQRGGPYVVSARAGSRTARALLRSDAVQLARRTVTLGLSDSEAVALLRESLEEARTTQGPSDPDAPDTEAESSVRSDTTELHAPSVP